MPTINATIGDASANSYVTLEEFETFIDERFDGDEYADIDEYPKIRALISACRRLNQESYCFNALDTTQALKFPIDTLVRIDGIEYDTGVIPTPVKYAQMTLAINFLSEAYSTDDSGLEAYEQLKSGDSEVVQRAGYRADTLPSNVRRYLRDLLVTSSGVGSVIRG